MNPTRLFRFAAALPLLFSGCATLKQPGTATNNAEPPPPPEMVAVYSPAPVVIDGALDDPAWKRATVYPMERAVADVESGKSMEQPGEIRLAWDQEYLYLAVSFTDSDIVAEGEGDQLHHYQLGDVVEWFIKPENNPWYWELYCTPNSRKTAFFYPSRGRLGLPSTLNYQCDLRVAAGIDGTVNAWKDTDQGWTAELAMPVADLSAHGDTVAPGEAWRVLVARYNYSFHLKGHGSERSSAPQLPWVNFHLLEKFATLKIEK